MNMNTGNDTSGKSKNNSMRRGKGVIFVDQINISSLISISFLRSKYKTILYFNPLSRHIEMIIRGIQKVGFFRLRFLKNRYHIGQVKNKFGASEYDILLRVTRSICNKIIREEISKQALINAVLLFWDESKVKHHFIVLAETEIKEEILRIGLIDWIAKEKMNLDSSDCLVLIKHKQWETYIQNYAWSRGFILKFYGKVTYVPLFFSKILIQSCYRFFLTMARFMKCILTNNKKTSSECKNNSYNTESLNIAESENPKIALHYDNRKLCFKSDERSEFFWLLNSCISYSNIILYNFVTDKPLDKTTLMQIKEYGITIFGQGPGISSWSPSKQMLSVFIAISIRLISAILSCLKKKKLPPIYFINQLFILGWSYAYWYDFFSTNRICVNVGAINTNIGQVLALEALDGISIGYQYSISNMGFPVSVLSAGENVQFVFSSSFEKVWKEISPLDTKYIQTGFIYDSAIKSLKKQNRIQMARQNITNNGANFIICFFDENSLDSWDIPVSNDDSAEDYEFLLKWLLNDPTLGLVFKPKRSLNLYQRISKLTQLIARAEESGRCLFMTSDFGNGNIFPAEAALTADLCIGKLLGGTASLEARLAGVPSIFIDTNGFLMHPFYHWGRDRIIFDSWSAARGRIEKYRKDPHSDTHLGDWMPWLDELDPFRDGQASHRIGNFVHWIYQEFRNGSDSKDAIKEAVELYRKKWLLKDTDFQRSPISTT